MTKRNHTALSFPPVKRRKVEADFCGGDITSNGGTSLLSQVDQQLGLTRAIDKALTDPRCKASCDHSILTLLRQRIYALALGYLASPSTLCRFEQRFDRKAAVAFHKVLFDLFVQAHPRPPKRLILDVDATDTPLHGEQDGRFFNGYYDHYCFLPLYVFCGRHLLVSYLRPSYIDAGKHSLAILALLVKALR